MTYTGGGLLLHHAHLDGRGLRAQADLRPDPEGVRLGLGRMVVGRVERREVVVLELDLGPLGDAEAEADEDVLDLALDLRQQVRRAARHGIARQRHVDGRLAQRGVELAATRAARAAGRAARSSAAAHAVQLLAARSAQLGRQLAELAQGERQRARASERLDARIFELGSRRGPLELFAPLSFQAGRVLHGHPRVDAGTRETPPRYHPACAVPGASRFRPLGGVPPGSGGELRRTVHAGALSLGPAPCRGRRPPTRLRRRRNRHSTACASASSSTGRRALRATGPALRSLVRRRRSRHRVLRARLRGRGRPDHRARRRQRAHRRRARAPRPPRDRARRGAGDARPGRSPRAPLRRR